MVILINEYGGTKYKMFRKAWLEHVGKTRKRENRGSKTCSYREAMKIASSTWAAEKKKLERRLKKEAKNKNRPEVAKPPKVPTKSGPQKTDEHSC